MNGDGVPQNYDEAKKWHCRAAEQGSAEAQAALGMLYLDGVVAAGFPAVAHKWLNLAASKEPKYADTREELADTMTREQLEDAQRMATAWRTKTWEEIQDGTFDNCIPEPSNLPDLPPDFFTNPERYEP